MAVPYIKSKEELKAYIFRRLGQPINRVELNDGQVDDMINDALELFMERAFDGTKLRFGLLDVTTGKQKYVLSHTTAAVIRVWDAGDSYQSTFKGAIGSDTNPQFTMAGGMDVLSLELTKQHRENMSQLTQTSISYNYNTTTKELYFFDPPDYDGKYGLLFYEDIDHDLYETSVYDNRWIKAMSVELCRRQWADNNIKFTSPALPNGLQTNYDRIRDIADAEIEKLRTELMEDWQLPLDFFMG